MRNSRLEMIEEFYRVLNQWMRIIESNQNIDEILIKNGINDIAVYGMGDMAKHIYNMLSGTKVNIRYFIDKKRGYYFGDIQTKLIRDCLDEEIVDAVIYTNPMEEGKTLEELKKYFKQVVYLGDIVFDNFSME